MSAGNYNTTADHGNTAVTTPEHALIDDLELRPPLLAMDDGVSSLDLSILHPLLCRMYVACNVLRLSNEARFTSLVLLHRYFGSINETLSVDWKWIAAACLFLGTKAEEESRRLRDIINVSHMLEFDIASQDKTDSSSLETISIKNKPMALDEEYMLEFDIASQGKTDSSSLETISVKNKPMALDEEYWTAKEKLVVTEQKVLRMLRFDCLVSHPHRAVAVLLSDIALGDKQELLLIAWKHLNQALFYAPALRYDVLTLACASIECAQLRLEEDKKRQSPLHKKEETHWWLTYGVSDFTLQECIQKLEQSVALISLSH